MQSETKPVRIRFAANGSMESSTGHHVRTITERETCEWLTAHGIAHRHATEVIVVKSPSNRSSSLFVPDIILASNDRDGRSVVIETLHSFSPKRGGLKAFTAFCKQYRSSYYTILVGKKASLESVPRGVCDAIVELENLGILARKLTLLEKHPESPVSDAA